MFPTPTGWKHQLPIIQAPTYITENKSSPLHHPAILVSLAATKWKLQLPVFKSPLEPLRTTVLPSTSQPPSNINLWNLNSLHRNKFIQWLTNLVAVLLLLLLCSALSASVSPAHTLHFLFFSIYTLCTISFLCNLPLLCISSPALCLLAHISILLHSDHNNSNNNGNNNTSLLCTVYIYSFCASCVCNIFHSSACSHRADILHLSSALPDHRNSSASMVVPTTRPASLGVMLRFLFLSGSWDSSSSLLQSSSPSLFQLQAPTLFQLSITPMTYLHPIGRFLETLHLLW